MNSIIDGKMTLTVLGCRGSMSVSGADKNIYGGASSCYMIEAAGEVIFLDAGTGIINAPELFGEHISVLITHPHIDHLMGFPIFLSANPGKMITVYGETRQGADIKKQLGIFLNEPLWPVSVDAYPVKLFYKEVKSGMDAPAFKIGPVQVTTMPSNHPGGSTIYGFSFQGKRIVYATDYEHDEKTTPMFVKFSEGADIVLYDAQYTPEEYEKCKGFGHSTYEKAVEFKALSGAKQVLLIHHAPNHDDEYMTKLQKRLRKLPGSEGISFAKEGQEIIL